MEVEYDGGLDGGWDYRLVQLGMIGELVNWWG